MKPPRPPSRRRPGAAAAAALLVAAVTFAGVPSAVGQEEPQDAVIDAIPSFDTDKNLACTCECCQVVERQPYEVDVLNNTLVVDTKCAVPMSADGSVCPQMCQVATNLISTPGESALQLYNRFCLNYCNPAADMVGSMCVGDGGGFTEAQTEDIRAPRTPILTMTTTQSPEVQQEQRVEQKVEKAKEQVRTQQRVTFDMRSLVAQRYRAEAASDVAQGMASAERARLAVDATARNTVKLRGVKTAMVPAKAALLASSMTALSAADSAQTAARSATGAFRMGVAAAPQLLKQVKDLSVTMLKAQAAPFIKAEADAYVRRMGWDKPDTWDRVLANRAAKPYVQQVSIAIQRGDEYKAYASSLESQAKLDDAQAEALEAQQDVTKAHHDLMTAANTEVQIQALRRKADKERADAVKAKKVSEEATASASEWQDAAQKASAYMSWKYRNTRTTPIPTVMA